MGIEIKGAVSQPVLQFINDYVSINFLDLCLMKKGEFKLCQCCKFTKAAKYKLVVEVYE